MRWTGIALLLCTGYVTAAVAFGGAQSRQAEDPTLPCLPVGGCPTTTTTTATTTTTTTTTTTETTPTPTATTPPGTQTTPPPTNSTPAPPPDANAPPVSDKPPPHHPAHHRHNGSTVAVLSDERTFTTWATYRRGAPVTSRPFGKGRRVASLHVLTADRLPEIYLILRSITDRRGHVSLRVRMPVRPNGTTGWVTRDALGTFHRVSTQIVIDRRTLRLSVYRQGRRTTSMSVGIGRAGTPTPAGHFWVDERFRVVSAPAYGPYAIGTTAFSPTLTDWPGGGVVGIHGTDQPDLIPGHISHGCVRVRNDQITRLLQLVPLGTPVQIV